jgi:tetratricopeptide (TPR) repeat protein
MRPILIGGATAWAALLAVGCGGDGGEGKKPAWDPAQSGAYFESGLKKGRMGDYDGAIADFTKSIEHNPGNSIAYRNRALAKREKGDYAGALADYDAALGLAPDDPLALGHRGVVKLLMRKDAEADRDFAEFAAKWPALKGQLDAEIAKARAKRGG